MYLTNADIGFYSLSCLYPEKYEGRLHDGRYFYFVFHAGLASLTVGELDGGDKVAARVGDTSESIFPNAEQRNSVFDGLLEHIRKREHAQTHQP